MEVRTIRYEYSENLPSVLEQLTGSLLLSSHTTGNVVVLDTSQGRLAFVGLSKLRDGSAQDGVPIAARCEQLKCGLAVVDLKTGAQHWHSSSLPREWTSCSTFRCCPSAWPLWPGLSRTGHRSSALAPADGTMGQPGLGIASGRAQQPACSLPPFTS